MLPFSGSSPPKQKNNSRMRGAWVVSQLSMTPDLGSDHDVRVTGSSPTSGSVLHRKSVYLSPSAPLLPLSKIKTITTTTNIPKMRMTCPGEQKGTQGDAEGEP